MRWAWFLLGIGLSPIAAAPLVNLPTEWHQGELTPVIVADTNPVGTFVVEFRRPQQDRAFLTVKGFCGAASSQTPSWGVALVGIDALTEPGAVIVTVKDAAGSVWSVGSGQIVAGSFHHETIELSQSASELREHEDPLVAIQAREIWKIYDTFELGVEPLPSRFQLPVPESTRVSGGFGDRRRYRYSDGGTSTDYHRGIDFAVPEGTPVMAPAAGRVVFLSRRILTGLTLVLEHGPGLYSVDFHLSRIAVKVGDSVTAGETVAYSGSTGFVTGPHLHWEIRSMGVPVDPLPLVQRDLLDRTRMNAVLSSIQQKRG